MSTETKLDLCPTQQRALRELVDAIKRGGPVVLWSAPGLGKSSILMELRRRHGGQCVSLKDFLDAAGARHPLSLEEAFFNVVWEALSRSDVAIMDDLHLLGDVVGGACGSYPRGGYLSIPMTVLVRYAQEKNKCLVFSASGNVPRPLSEWCNYITIQEFQAADYDDLCATFLGAEAAATLDFRKIHRFAPRLSAHQLRAACLWFKGRTDLSTETFIDLLRARQLSTNVDLGEVQAVKLEDLKASMTCCNRWN